MGLVGIRIPYQSLIKCLGSSPAGSRELLHRHVEVLACVEVLAGSAVPDSTGLKDRCPITFPGPWHWGCATQRQLGRGAPPNLLPILAESGGSFPAVLRRCHTQPWLCREPQRH